MQRFYFLPKDIITKPSGSIVNCSKYLYERYPGGVHEGIDIGPHSKMDYGLVPAFLVYAPDVTQAAHDALVAYPDVVSPPENLDTLITAQALPTVQATLEALKIPAHWVTEGMSYRIVLRRVVGLFQFSQRHSGLHDELLVESQAALDLTWAEVPVAKRQRVAQTADSFGFDYSTVAGSWTVRETLIHLSNQWTRETLILWGVEI